MSSDPLADFWVHLLTVERYLGPGEAGGKSYAAAETVLGYYSDKQQYAPGGQITSAGRFAFPSTVAYIPLQSRVTLPAKFGGRTTQVVTVSVGDAGDQPTPNHQQIGVM